jgi:hypothetical protein
MRVAATDGVMPFDAAFAADDDFVLAWVIARGENAGGEFLWDQMKWMEK